MERKFLRGDVYYANFNTVDKNRGLNLHPILVLQNDSESDHVIVAPITRPKRAILPTHIVLDEITSLGKDSVVVVEQIIKVDKHRVNEYIGTLNEELIEEVNYALVLCVGLNANSSNPIDLCLCPSCAKYFFDSPAHYIIRNDSERVGKACMYCNMPTGFDFTIGRKVKEVIYER